MTSMSAPVPPTAAFRGVSIPYLFAVLHHRSTSITAHPTHVTKQEQVSWNDSIVFGETLSTLSRPCNLITRRRELLTHTLPLQLVMGDGTRFIDP